MMLYKGCDCFLNEIHSEARYGVANQLLLLLESVDKDVVIMEGIL